MGDDANPCSRTAPCKTFAGAISKTAAGGEIDVLDPGGFGAVTITKSLTISATGVTASTLTGGGVNGIVIAAGANDNVVIHGIAVSGGLPLSQGLNGIRIISAKSVRVENAHIFGFAQNGIDFEPNSVALLVVQDSTIEHNGGDGVLNAPQAPASASVLVRNSQIENNTCGVVAASFGPSGNFASNCGTNTSGTAAVAAVSTIGSSVSVNSGTGAFSSGPSAYDVISRDTVEGNNTGLGAAAGGSILSFGNNEVFFNVNDGTPTGTVAFKSRDVAGKTRAMKRLWAKANARARAWNAKHRRHVRRLHTR